MTDDPVSEKLARMAAQVLRLDPPPNEAEITEVLARLAVAFTASKADVDTAQRLLHSRFDIRMEMGQTIEGDAEHAPWLDARRGSIDPFFWNRYHEFLLRDGWSPMVASTLNRSMDELLDLLGNPAAPGPWKRRGLVVGDVQSGKTASYSALICKAADAGYKMVILLTGTLENVRRQTQERLDASFVGLDSRDFLSRNQLKHKTHIGVGRINGQRDGIVFTSRDRDFRAQIASALNISLKAVREPVLVVAKKNSGNKKGVLYNLATWLKANNADIEGKIDLPLLLIDDEADNASINTRNKPDQTTAINGAIRELLGLFTRSSYVGFTATPFANIFVDPSSTDVMLGDDLFPRDFIHLLQPPTNYIGMERIFFPLDPENPGDGSQEAQTAGIRTIDDSDPWLPVGHDQGHRPVGLSASLLTALRYFLLTCAVRDIRIASGGDGREKGIHRSMLVNVSRFTAVQDEVANQIHLELDRIRQQVRLYGKLPPEQAATQSPEIAVLAQLFVEELPDLRNEWPKVLDALHESISPIRVQPVNQRTGAAGLDYSAIKEPPGLRVIAVGGNSLSRGLTLEGLNVSYFLRNSKTYDTLLQMGRWFGYRQGYEDLCRVWMTTEAESWYRHITEATTELKRDFARMRRQKATPEEFGLRVRTHPDTLLITARNKMATGVDYVGEVRDISLAGRGIETSRLYADQRRNEENFRIVDRFLFALTAKHGAGVASPSGSARCWNDVPATIVAALLEEFLVHPQNHDFQGDAIAQYLITAAANNDPLLSNWTIAVPTDGKQGPLEPPLSSGLAVEAKGRAVLVKKTPPESLLVSGRTARVGSAGDVRFGLTSEFVRQVIDNEIKQDPKLKPKDVPEDSFRAAMQRPLLIIYLLRGYQRGPKTSDGKKGEDVPYKNRLVLPALGLHFPGHKEAKDSRRYVKYRLNLVAQSEFEIDGDDTEEDDDTD